MGHVFKYFYMSHAQNKRFYVNEEYPGFVTLVDPENNADVGRTMLAAGYVLVEKRREKGLRNLVKDYLDSQDIARTNRVRCGLLLLT